MPDGMWNLPRPGIKAMSSALAGEFLTTGPQGKSRLGTFITPLLLNLLVVSLWFQYISLIAAAAVAAAAKSLQSCPTLYNPIGGSPPGSPVPGIIFN